MALLSTRSRIVVALGGAAWALALAACVSLRPYPVVELPEEPEEEEEAGCVPIEGDAGEGADAGDEDASEVEPCAEPEAATEGEPGG